MNTILNVKDKLQFYNDNICSLSNNFYNGEIYEFGTTEYYWRGLGNLLFKAVPNENIYETYLEIRANEVKRLQCLIAGQSTTIEKLKILFEKRAGKLFFSNEACKVYTNDFITFLRNGAGAVPNNIKEYDIDLSYLRTSEEIKEYNQYLYNFYFKIFKKEAVLPIINGYEYNGFDFELTFKEFQNQLKNSLDIHKTLNNEIKRIELFFPLNDFNTIIYRHYDSNKPLQWQCALFNGFINGLQYDLGRIKLEVQQIKDLIHIEQVFCYYKELLELRKRGSFDNLQNITIAPLPQQTDKQIPELNKTELSETHQKPTPALKEFISENLDKALIINLLDYPLINDVLQRQKDKLRDAEFESEFSEINEFAIKGIKEIKNRLQLHLRTYPDNPYKNGFDLVLLDIHLFHEYNEIYNKSLNPSTVQQQSNIEPSQSQQVENADFYTQTYNNDLKPVFPFNELNLIPMYYDSKLQKHLEQRKKLLGNAFVEQSEKKVFIQSELEDCKNVINHYSELFKNRRETFKKHTAVVGKGAYKIWLESLSNGADLKPQLVETKADVLKEHLTQYGFFELERIKVLSQESRISIIQKISECGLPYAIAMFDYLQYIQYLEKSHFDSKYKLNKEVSKWFCKDKGGRAVKGNISSLLKNTTENKERYTAYKHIENVKKDYEQLK
jgi:hypothetical protein